MIPFLVIAVVMVTIACAWVLVPLLSRRQDATIGGQASNLSVLRDQRAELKADLANGVISPEQYEVARAELDRRVLEEAAGDAAGVPAASRASAWTAAMVGAGIPVAAVLLYLILGTPSAFFPGLAQVPHGDTQSGTSPQEIETMIGRVKERLATKPDDLEGWVVLARTYYVLGRAKEAAGAYERATALSPNDADLLADYADAVGMTQNRSLEGEPEAIVARALRANPNQWKANALAGTMAFQRGNYRKAIEHWERVKATVPADSPVAQSIDSSLAEARQLAQGAKDRTPAAGTKVAAQGTKDAMPAAGAKVAGMVTLSPALADGTGPDDTVFVFARPADGSRMPLALLRVKVRDLPLAFTLDDSTAMMANRKLSDYAEVIVGARVSKSGSATPQSGDLEATLPPVKLGVSGIKLVIDRRLP
jgi:cytochrome c-type biogenesis protein CcmH